MYQIRVKNIAKNNQFIKELDKLVYTKNEADKVFSCTVESLVNLDVEVLLYCFKTNGILDKQHCQVLG